MKRFLRRFVASFAEVFAGALALMLVPAAAVAQELPDVSAPCLTADAGVQLRQAGEPGLWFEMGAARCVLQRLEALPLYADRVRLLEQRLQLDDERHELMERQVSLAVEAQQRAEEALLAAERRAREATQAASFERDLRWLWVGVGIAVTVVVQVLAIWALSELDP